MLPCCSAVHGSTALVSPEQQNPGALLKTALLSCKVETKFLLRVCMWLKEDWVRFVTLVPPGQDQALAVLCIV